MYQTSFRCMRPVGCGTSTYIIRIGLNENSRFQIVRRRMTPFERSKSVSVLGFVSGSYSSPGIEIGTSSSGRGPLNISASSGAGLIVVSTPGANGLKGIAAVAGGEAAAGA